jgi:ribosomal protein S18 acetylase RimI-like enzyme
LIRDINRDDIPAVVAIAVDSGLFPAEHAGFVEKMMDDYFAGRRDEGHRCVIDVADEPIAIAYYEPALATDRTWYLTMIGVRGGSKGQGRGTALMHHMEDDLRTRRQRLLLVETSSTTAFDRTRTFYKKCGYDEEARVRDYYEPGDDMILFRKML